MNWTIALIAIALWFAATMLYCQRFIRQWWIEHRKRKAKNAPP